jgi:hypothetical protein
MLRFLPRSTSHKWRGDGKRPRFFHPQEGAADVSGSFFLSKRIGRAGWIMRRKSGQIQKLARGKRRERGTIRFLS